MDRQHTTSFVSFVCNQKQKMVRRQYLKNVHIFGMSNALIIISAITDRGLIKKVHWVGSLVLTENLFRDLYSIESIN